MAYTLSACYQVRLCAWVESTGWPILTIPFNLYANAFPCILHLSVAFVSSGWWHKQICGFRCFITSVLQACTGCDLQKYVATCWLAVKWQRLLGTTLKVQHGRPLKTIAGNCWWRSPTCTGKSLQVTYEYTQDCRWLLVSCATVSNCRRLTYKPGFSPCRSVISKQMLQFMKISHEVAPRNMPQRTPLTIDHHWFK